MSGLVFSYSVTFFCTIFLSAVVVYIQNTSFDLTVYLVTVYVLLFMKLSHNVIIYVWCFVNQRKLLVIINELRLLAEQLGVTSETFQMNFFILIMEIGVFAILTLLSCISYFMRIFTLAFKWHVYNVSFQIIEWAAIVVELQLVNLLLMITQLLARLNDKILELGMDIDDGDMRIPHAQIKSGYNSIDLPGKVNCDNQNQEFHDDHSRNPSATYFGQRSTYTSAPALEFQNLIVIGQTNSIISNDNMNTFSSLSNQHDNNTTAMPSYFEDMPVVHRVQSGMNHNQITPMSLTGERHTTRAMVSEINRISLIQASLFKLSEDINALYQVQLLFGIARSTASCTFMLYFLGMVAFNDRPLNLLRLVSYISWVLGYVLKMIFLIISFNAATSQVIK